MMTWNFRLVKHPQSKSGAPWDGVHEVFYNEAGKPWTMTKEPVQVEGESAKDVLAYLNLIKRDLKRLPILNAGKLKWAKPPEGVRGGRTRKFKNVKDLMSDLHERSSEDSLRTPRK